MARVYVGSKSVAVLWDFAVDAGAVSTIQLGDFIPDNSIITYFGVKTLVAPVTATGGTFAFGWTGDTDALMVVQASANFVVDEVRQGVDFNDAPVTTTANRQIAVTIGTGAVTAGRLLAICDFRELDL